MTVYTLILPCLFQEKALLYNNNFKKSSSLKPSPLCRLECLIQMCAITVVPGGHRHHYGGSILIHKWRLVHETVRWSEKHSGWDPSLDSAAMEVFSNWLFLPVSLFPHVQTKKDWSLRPLLCVKFYMSGSGNWIAGRPGIKTRFPQAKLTVYSTDLLCLPLSNNYCFMPFEGLY